MSEAASALSAQALEAVETAHRTLWSRFVDSNGIILDYSAEIPTAKDCAECRPNALSWWLPIENGGFFTGLYLSAACDRWERTHASEDREAARTLASGLMRLATLADVPGFIARGIAADGAACYPLGSDDQTHPWFYGLWRYLRSGIAGGEERAQIAALMSEVGEALDRYDWRCPCAGAFRGQWRGEFCGGEWRAASRLLFMLRALHEVTGERKWLERYEARAVEKPRGSGLTRLQICAVGYEHDREHIPSLEQQLWIAVGAQLSLQALARWEQGAGRVQQFREGMRRTAELARPVMGSWQDFAQHTQTPFVLDNWRLLDQWWRPQAKVAEAVDVAQEQMRQFSRLPEHGGRMTRRTAEMHYVRDPFCAAWMLAIAGDQDLRLAALREMEAALPRFDYAALKLSVFWCGECAAEALLAAASP
jgi:hypothetical protein